MLFCDGNREFTRTHGRPVMRQEDIQPVAQEYRRYKVDAYSFNFKFYLF